METQTVVNAGRGPQPKADRDQQLIADYKAFIVTKQQPMSWLIGKYQLSPKRIYEILHKHGVTLRYKKSGK